MKTCKIVGANDHWRNAKLGLWLSYTKNGKYSRVVLKNGNNKPFYIKSSQVWLVKNNKRRYTSSSSELIRQTRRNRFRKPVSVVATRFRDGQTYGDATQMVEHRSFANGVFVFNDNDSQFTRADPNNVDTFQDPMTHIAGGGNARVRPWQLYGDAIGMPTGPYANLFDSSDTVGGTAKAAIIEACERIINLFINRPDKEILYYSVNTSDLPGSLQIGLGIFSGRVGSDVRVFITVCLHHIPAMVECKRILGHGAEFYINNVMPLLYPTMNGPLDSTVHCRTYLEYIESFGPSWDDYLKSAFRKVLRGMPFLA